MRNPKISEAESLKMLGVLARARLSEGKWVFGFITHYGGLVDIYEIERNSLGRSTYTFDKDTLCRYTGLRDKAGNRVFEGDFLEFDKIVGVPVKPYKIKKIILRVVWDNYIPRVEGDSRGTGMPDPDEMLVVGNIFDNPNFLGEIEK